jgi:hypothetical protein
MAATFTTAEVDSFKKLFKSVNISGSGKLDTKEVQELMRRSGEEVSFGRVEEVMAAIDTNRDGVVDFEEFVQCMSAVKGDGSIGSGGVSAAVKQFGAASSKAATLIQVQGSSGGIGVHSISEEERTAFAEHINQLLGKDPSLAGRLPMDPASPTALFECCKDGIVFAKLVNHVEPGTVDERALNLKANLSKFQMIENNNLAINAAKSIGCSLVNVGASNLLDGTPYLVLGVAWQIIRKTLLNSISLKNHPELFRLLQEPFCRRPRAVWGQGGCGRKTPGRRGGGGERERERADGGG